MQEQRLIVVTGPIGVGKTVTLENLRGLDYYLVPEEVDNKVGRFMIDQYYQATRLTIPIIPCPKEEEEEREKLRNKREGVIATTQFWFMKTRRKSLLEALKQHSRVMIERHLWDDLLIFTQHNYEEDLLTKYVYQTIQRAGRSWIQDLIKPSLVFILMASPNELRERIRKRGRQEEAHLLDSSNPYLERNVDLYGSMHHHLNHRELIPATLINTDGISEEETAKRVIEEHQRMTRPFFK